MLLMKLNESEPGKFMYNVLVGIVTTIIMDLSTNIANNILIPLFVPMINELEIKLKKDKNKKILVGNLFLFLIRTLVVYFILSIIIKKII
jgi:hypothetical protein